MTVTVENDLRAMFGPARDQGPRPTCLAFATSDAHASLRTPWVPLSPEYIFYHAQQRGGRSPSVGAALPDMMAALKHDGQPEEKGWAYLSPPIDPKTWIPPAKVAPPFRRGNDSNRNGIDDIIIELKQGRPVLVLMTISGAFFLAASTEVVDGTEPPNIAFRHAVVAVASGTYKNERVILMRNSWGPAWGTNGYAWLSERYLKPRIFELAFLKEDLSVPDHSAAA
jgi:hypothetical protein